MYGQPTRRPGADGAHGAHGNGDENGGAKGNGYAPPQQQPPPQPRDDFSQYAPSKPLAPTRPQPPPHQQAQAFYQPPAQQGFYGGGEYGESPASGRGGFGGGQGEGGGHGGFLPASPTLSSASGGGPPMPPPMPALNGYQPQQQGMQQPQYQPQYQPQQHAPPQQQPMHYAGSGGFMPQQQYMPPQQQQQQQIYQPPQHYQQAPMQQQTPMPPQQQPVDPFQAAQGMALQFGAAQMISGIAQQLGGGGDGGGAAAAAAAPQMLQNFGVQRYFTGAASGEVGDVNTFMRVPKHYFAVNHSYVLRKLALLVMPFQRRSWSRRAGVDQRQFERQGSEDATAYLPPRDDVNAPDLYIPVMAFVSYVLLVGFVFGTRGTFTAEVLAKYFSKGFGVLTLEVLVIKLGLYLISARPTPWLDVIAYRGYKFVGVIIAMLCELVFPRLYYFVFFYTAFAMAIFLMRSHRRIILPQGSERQSLGDLPQRNAFLLFVCALQFPIYWLLILDVR